MKTIEIENLVKYYGTARGIDGVSLTAERGEILGFIGPNGAGKSTTIRTALGLLRPTSGSARILGTTAADPARLFPRVGYLPADVHSYDRMRVGRFLELTGRFYPRDCRTRIAELIELLGIDPTRRFGRLSSGNRKKVGIAQAFLHSPEVVILDEPTNGLDPLVRARFYDLINRERDRGTTILFSSHTLSEVQAQCTRITIIREGRIVETGPIAELRRGSVRRVTMSGPAAVVSRAAAIAVKSDQMTIEHREPSRIAILLRGSTGPLLATLPLADAGDVRVEEPSLEEIFLHFYASGESVHA